MARQIEVLSERLRVLTGHLNRSEIERQVLAQQLSNAKDDLSDQREEIAALRAKLPPDPPAKPTAGETLANCKQAIFPQER